MRHYKIFVWVSVGIFALAMSVLAVFFTMAYLFDPLQLYHKSYFWETKFVSNMRAQAKAIIKYYDYDSFIVGTSMLQNTSNLEANKTLGDNWINVSPHGSSLNERAVILDYIFRQKGAKQILYSLDIYVMMQEDISSTSGFDFIYDTIDTNDMRVYMNAKYYTCIFDSYMARKNLCGDKTDINTLTDWTQWTHDRIGGFDKWLAILEKLKREKGDYFQYKPIIESLDSRSLDDVNTIEFAEFDKSIQRSTDIIQTYLIDIIKAHPETRFLLIVPPYSTLHYKTELITEPTYFSHWSRILKWTIAECDKLDNATIYGFDDLAYTDNIAHYKDPTHYWNDMNSLQLQSIAQGEHILTSNNIDSYLENMRTKIMRYDLKPFWRMLKDYDATLQKN